jgi:hypothetical protein
MTMLLWVLGAALAALVVTRVALRLRAGGRSPLHRLARDYLSEQLRAQGIADKVPSRCMAEIAERYASVVQSRPLGRIAAASELMRRMDAAVAFIAEWVRDGREFPRSIAEMSLPGLGVPDMLQDLEPPDSDH